MGLKVDTIQNPSSATVNLTLDTSGNVGVGANQTIAGTLAVAGTSTFTGSLGNITVGTVTASGLVTGATGALYPVIQRTALTLTTQTAPEFTSIPSWVKRITLMFSVVSTNGANNITIQIGTGGAATISGYTAQTTGISQSVGSSISSTVGFPSYSNAAVYAWSGIVTISNIFGNVWVASGVLGNTGTNILSSQISGVVGLSGTLDYLRLISSATGSPSDQFDSGVINIQYE